MKNSRIVLIEDNPADVYLVEMAFRRQGIAYDLIWFESGESAAEVLCAPGLKDAMVPDTILLDLNTPACDGFEVLRDLKSAPALAHVPVAVISSSQAGRDRRLSEELGAWRYIEKASRLEEFLNAVGGAVKEMLCERAQPREKVA